MITLATFTHSFMGGDNMAAMKSQMEDICYFWRDGLTMEQIAKLCNTDVDDVKYTIETYYDLMMGA